MDTGLDSVAFSNSSEYVEFIEDDSNGSPYSSNLIEERTKRNNNVLRRVLIGGLVLLVICVVILFGWIWLKPSLPNVESNSTLCSKSSSNLQNLKSNYPQMEFRRRFVREMMLDSWKAYKKYVPRPVSKIAFIEEPGHSDGLSFVASMSSLWTIDLLDEFERGKKWIETRLDLSKLDRNVRVFEVVTHYVGGLLSCYALTNDSMFLNKAKEIAQLVEPAFNTTTGIPYENINLNSSEAEGNNQFLSYMSGFQVDFNYLSDVTNETKYRNMINRIQQNLKKKLKSQKIFSMP